MNRKQFILLGRIGIALVLPYLAALFIPSCRTAYPALFSAAVLCGLAGIMTGILWLMFFLEYRGVWFSKEDAACPVKFESGDMPSIRELDGIIRKDLGNAVLYSWNMTFRPVLLPDCSKAYNIRFDFISSGEPFTFAGKEMRPECGEYQTFDLRALMKNGKMEILEFRTGRKNALSSPADKSVSPLDLKDSKRIAERVEALLEGTGLQAQIAYALFHRRKRSFIQLRMELFSEKDETLRIGSQSVLIKARKREGILFRLSPDLRNADGLRKLPMLTRLFSAG